jgi:signal transduction histidine kinase
MSHELRTPLNSIINIARLLLARLDGDLSPEQAKQVTLIRDSASHLTEMVNDLLDLARIEAGKTALRLGDVEVPELLAGLRGVFRPLLTSDRVALVFEAREPLPTLRTDEGRLSQILRNLIGNAVKFTEQGEVRVSAERAPDGRVTFTVADTGIGIAPEDQERIFEEYEQVDTPLQARVAGTGLGLPLSRKLARLLGGDLTLASTPGAGSVFRLVLPVRAVISEEAADVVESPRE